MILITERVVEFLKQRYEESEEVPFISAKDLRVIGFIFGSLEKQ
jgi:hypothetical protein